MTNLTNILKIYRESAGLTQKELAKKVNVRRETIVHLENNRYNPSLELALEIAHLFNVSVEDIFQLDKYS